MSIKSRARHLARVGQPPAEPPAPVAAVCQHCLRLLARADRYPIDAAMLELYLDVRGGTGQSQRLGPLDHAGTIEYMAGFVAALDSAGEHYWRLTELEGEAETGVTHAEMAELEAWQAQRDRWAAEPDEDDDDQRKDTR